MIPKQINDFFDAFGKEAPGIILPASNSLEENAKLWAEHQHLTTEAGHGLFLDFKNVPELERHAIYQLQKLGWILEKPFFIRKQDLTNN